MSELLKKIGQLFIVGFSGETPSKNFLNFFVEENIGGVILFQDNCPTNQVVRNNIDLIKKECTSGIPLIAIDQEGGRVCRLKGAPAEIKAASEYAETLGLERFKEDYSRSSFFIESLGVNLNLAPVSDIFINKDNKCLNSRCYGNTPEQVIPFINASVTISKKHGLLSCLKHFPGLGASAIDPHLETAIADYDEMIWSQREKLTFAAGIERGADMVMTTHLKLPRLDDTHITTFSSKIISVLLRKILGFEGPVISDDLTMKGITVTANPGEIAVNAFNAGHDLLLYGQDFETAMIAYDYFREAFLRGEIAQERVQNALDRIAGVKFKLGKSVIL